VIPDALWLAALARAEEPAPTEEADPLEQYRASVDVLAERAIGTTSTPVEFDWRKSPVQFAATGSFLVELNNFDSARIGGMARLPSGGFLVELGATWVGVWDTPSSRMLALTPYRQPGRPDRLELDVTVGVPLAEGVVTAVPRFFPAVEMVLNGFAGLRYDVYPSGWAHLTPKEVGAALVSPALTEPELDDLEAIRPDAMEIDPQRYGIVAGLGDDLYFEPGFFVSPRVMFGVPLLAPATGTDLLLTADLTLVLGFSL
jgi:hypothetical protein